MRFFVIVAYQVIAQIPDGTGNLVPQGDIVNLVPQGMADGVIDVLMNGAPNNAPNFMPVQPQNDIFAQNAAPEPVNQPQQQPLPEPANQPQQQPLLQEDEGVMNVIPKSIQNILMTQIEAQRGTQTRTRDKESKPTGKADKEDSKSIKPSKSKSDDMPTPNPNGRPILPTQTFKPEPPHVADNSAAAFSYLFACVLAIFANFS